jgi:hypothetical protein
VSSIFLQAGRRTPASPPTRRPQTQRPNDRSPATRPVSSNRVGPLAGTSECASRRETFLDSYTANLVNRDVIQVAHIERAREMRQLIRLMAAQSGQLLVPQVLSTRVGLPVTTVRRYLDLLEEVFLTKRIPAWSRNLSPRATGTAKSAFVDSGIAASQLGQTAERLSRPDRRHRRQGSLNGPRGRFPRHRPS